MSSSALASAPCRLVLRADGGPTIGLGHLMRLLALADTVRTLFAETVFVVQAPTPALQDLLAGAGLVVQAVPPLAPPAEAAWLLQQVLQPTDILVVDGYGFDFEYQQAVQAGVSRLVCLDDLCAFPFAADVVLNPAGGLARGSYDLRHPQARLLAGPRYAPLRAAFWPASRPLPADAPPAAGLTPAPAEPSVVLVCLGGADPAQLTQSIAAQLLALPPAAVREVHVVAGAAYQGWNALCAWAAAYPRLRLHRALSAPALAELMRQCGSAVLSPSTISYEYCAASGGLLFTLRTADNQQDMEAFLLSSGLALPYSAAPDVLPGPEAAQLALRLRGAQQLYFDGLAPRRLRQVFAALQVPAPCFRLRPVQEQDAELLLEWTNDPVVRQHSFQPAPVPRSAHEAWLRARLADPASLLLLAEDLATQAPVGLVRFQVQQQTALLSYQIAAAWRGRRLAAPLLVAGTTAAQAHFPDLRQVRGYVQPTNQASVRAFERAGFGEEAAAPDGSFTFVWHV